MKSQSKSIKLYDAAGGPIFISLMILPILVLVFLLIPLIIFAVKKIKEYKSQHDDKDK